MTMPLEGIRVLDWTAFQQGPIAGALLADMGAEVIKIEEPRGDPARGLAAIYGLDIPFNYYFQNQNRGKRGIILNFTKERGQETLYKLVEKSDVFLTNYRYSHALKMKVDYETLSRYNSRLIYAYSSSYGMLGPDADLPSSDFAGQARGGLWMVSLAPDLTPVPLGAGVVDEVGGVLTAYGILLALLARERTGEGQMVNTSLLGGQVEMVRLSLQLFLILGAPAFMSPAATMSSPLWNLYRCQDEKWFCVAVLQPDRYWPSFCKVLGIEELEKDPRFENAGARRQHLGEIMSILNEVFLTKPRDEWWQAFRAEAIPSSPVNDLSDLANDPQVIANEYIVEVDDPAWGKVKVAGIPVKLSKTPGKVKALAPELGQHTEEVLMEICGYTWDDIAKLREDGVF